MLRITVMILSVVTLLESINILFLVKKVNMLSKLQDNLHIRLNTQAKILKVIMKDGGINNGN